MRNPTDTEIARRVAVASRDARAVEVTEVRCLPGVAAVARMPGGIFAIGVGGAVAFLDADSAAEVATMIGEVLQGRAAVKAA